LVSPDQTHDALRCPRCAAHVPIGAQWCSLCYADLRPAPEPVAEPVVPVAAEPTPGLTTERVAVGGGIDQGGIVGESVAVAVRHGRHSRSAAEPAAGATSAVTSAPDEASAAAFGAPTQSIEDARLEAISAELLARLAAETRPSTRLTRAFAMVDSTPKRVGLMLGGLTLISTVLFAVMTIFGSLL
jgi:hypothetical protein